MPKRQRGTYRVIGAGHDGTFVAGHPAGAVKLFRKRFRVGRCEAIRRDPETGGWRGLSVDVLPAKTS